MREGRDATIIANRDLVVQALVAAELLAKKGIDVRVIDCHTLKPLDEQMVLKAAEETGAIVTAENNIIFGGLGSAVAEVLVENYPIPMKRIGVQDTFAESGPVPGGDRQVRPDRPAHRQGRERGAQAQAQAPGRWQIKGKRQTQIGPTEAEGNAKEEALSKHRRRR